MALGRYAAAANLFCRIAFASAGRRRRRSLQERLGMIPVEGAPVSRPVEIHWDEHQVPFIEAQADDDLATALGIVHAHLRLGQMELMRRIAQGRICELAGSLGAGIDQTVRTFDLARAVPDIIASMPPETRSWLEHFASGVNHCLSHAHRLPQEFSLLGLRREPWTIADIVTLGRLIAADVNWIVWLRLLRFRNGQEWPRLWKQALRHDLLSFASSEKNEVADMLAGAALRSGSNSFAVAVRRSTSGGALMANDPHLSIMLPNAWLIAGMKSPSHHAVGLMVPGIPFIAIGRNPWIAWGGASLHAASSDLVAVPKDADLKERLETLKVRGEADRVLRIRESPYGPVISDLPALRAPDEVLALRWMGHRPSDEFTAMLRVGQARNWDAFRQAFNTYALPGLEMNYADADGHIGQLMAAKLPRRHVAEPHDIVSPAENGWDDPMESADLPSRFDPAEGFLASANARPASHDAIVGFHFSPRDRLLRLCDLLSANPHLAAADLMRIQRDVHLAVAILQRDRLLSWLPDTKQQSPLGQVLKDWDGHYDAQSAGALAFELLMFHLARELIPRARLDADDAAWGTRALVWADVAGAEPSARATALERSRSAAARDFRPGMAWGALHRLHLGHPLGALPVIGRRFHFADLPASGTSETLMKTAHGSTNRRHRSTYGSVARHVSDLSDPNANHFALLGGQDGWFGSSTFIDQVALWQRGDYVTVPLDPEVARSRFAHKTILRSGTRP